MLQKILTSSRYVILLGVLGSFLAALASLIYGGIKAVAIVISLFQGSALAEKSTKLVAVSFVEVIDLFLLGTVFYIIALGLYELFIDDSLDLPTWLVVHDLDDLKAKLISGVVVIMGVYFLGALVSWDGQTDLLRIGLPIALVIAALTFFQFVKIKQKGH